MEMKVKYKHDMAREILGSDFIYPEIIRETRGVAYPCAQLQYLMQTFPSKNDLERCCDNEAILIAGAPGPMSLLEIRELNAGHFYDKTGGWWSEPHQLFSHQDKVYPEWLMLCKNPVQSQGYKNNTWMERLGLVSKAHYTPNAAELAWGITTCREIHSTWLFPDIHMGTSSLDSEGSRIFIGFSAIGGIGVNCSWSICCLDPTGVAVALKQNTKNSSSLLSPAVLCRKACGLDQRC